LEHLIKKIIFFLVFLLSIAILCSLWRQNNKQKQEYLGLFSLSEKVKKLKKTLLISTNFIRQQILARTGKWFQQQQQQTHLNDNVFQEQTTQQHQLPQKSSDFSISEHTKTTQQNEKLQRKQSLSSQQQKRNSLTRQNTLKRQQTIEQPDEKNMKQQPIINGTTEELPKTSNETSKWNGQTRKSIKQQREQQNKSFRQQSFNVQNSLDEENNNREKENVRKTLQKQVSNKVGNALPRQQTQQQQHNLQQQQRYCFYVYLIVVLFFCFIFVFLFVLYF